MARLTVACAMAGALSGCAGPLSTLDPAGPVAASTARLWWVMLTGSVVLFALVGGLLMLAFARPQRYRNVPAAWWLVGGGLVLPGVVLTPLLAYALWRGDRLVAATMLPAAEVDVIARQWEWGFAYRDKAGQAAKSVNVLHIQAGQPVRLNVTGADVIHSFWVPRLAGKIDAIPGHVTTLRLVADTPGIYRGLCAEFCGRVHLEMQFVVQAHASAADLHAALAALPRAADHDLIEPRTRRD